MGCLAQKVSYKLQVNQLKVKNNLKMKFISILLMVIHQTVGNLEETIKKEYELLGDSCEAMTRLEWALARGVGGLNGAEISLIEEDLVWGKNMLNSAREKTHQLKDIISLKPTVDSCLDMTAVQASYSSRAKNIFGLIRERNRAIDETFIFIDIFDEHFPGCGEIILHPIRYFIKIFFIDIILLLISTPGLLWTFRSQWAKCGLFLCMNMVAIILLVTRLEFCSSDYIETRDLFEDKLMVLKNHPFHETMNMTLAGLDDLNIFQKHDNRNKESDYLGEIFHLFINFLKFF